MSRYKDFTQAKQNEMIEEIDRISNEGVVSLGEEIWRFLTGYNQDVDLEVAKQKMAVYDTFDEVSFIDSRYFNLVDQCQDDGVIPVRMYLYQLTQIITPGSPVFAGGGNNIRAHMKGYKDDLPYSNAALASGANKSSKYGTFDSDADKICDDFKECSSVVERYHPELKGNDQKIKEYVDDFFENFPADKCAYVALATSLFEAYKGREDEFLRMFHFPLYTEDGHFNYAALIMDCMESQGKDLDLTEEDIARIWEKYAPTGTDVENFLNVNPNNLESKRGEGEILINLRDSSEQSLDGKNDHSIPTTMLVEGVTPDGKYIVSSPGKGKDYIDPKDYWVYREVGSLVQYTDSSGNTYSAPSFVGPGECLVTKNGGPAYYIKKETGSFGGTTWKFLDVRGNTIPRPEGVPIPPEDNMRTISYSRVSY